MAETSGTLLDEDDWDEAVRRAARCLRVNETRRARGPNLSHLEEIRTTFEVCDFAGHQVDVNGA
jgi:hypothetical protein